MSGTAWYTKHPDHKRTWMDEVNGQICGSCVSTQICIGSFILEIQEISPKVEKLRILEVQRDMGGLSRQYIHVEKTQSVGEGS